MPLDYPVHERTLPNGLRVVVSPDPSVPNVTLNIWVGVGSRHETPGRTGFAHLFEHLMFQGSRSVASGEHFEALMAQGGRLNATTWFDRTNYFETVPKGALELALWLEADRHGHLLDAVNQANLDNQRDVVKEEKRQRYDNQPYGNALTDVYATVFPEGHPYHHPTIGSMEDLDAASVEDVHAFFTEHYAPDNTVVTLCGDIEVEDGFALVERYFGHIAANPRDRRGPVDALGPLAAPVRLERTEDVPNDRLHLAFRLPVDETPEFDAASLALDALGGLASSRLVRRLVRREQIALGVHATAWGFVDGVSLGFVVLDVVPEADTAAVEAAVLEELERFAVDGPTEAELDAALAQAERSWLSMLASQEERADALSSYALLHGDPGRVNTHLDRLRAVTPEQVRDAAATWLRPDSRAVVAYLAAGEKEEVA
ncbi:putative Zn-dependent peptidase [Knoellia remsis]|uniref:Putative Zn-dependent peptidase n=1 Tax=Knoellia remsis TaxID=407159 RepID=A0A2T0UYE9_9MICO|nr:pitrilysin family protein [Knoellia remsis]PRY62960.1 putative Zn-dependent peptidase [Knoellia remsis]